jgi:hypothetical protein
MPFGKVNGVAKAHDFAQKIGAVAEALENAGQLLAAGFLTPFVLDLCDLAVCVCFFNQLDLGFVVRHESSAFAL